jgi:hypothetical protein
MNEDQRVVALEARVTRLEHTLHPARALAEAPRQVTLTYPTETNARFIMTSDDELTALHRIVLEQYPNLQAKDQSFDEAHAGFARAFLCIGHMGRTDVLNEKYDLLSWVYEAKNFLRERGQATFMTGNDFIIAAIAHGDINYLSPATYPSCSGFGLMLHGGGRPARDAWKTVLRDRRCRSPVATQMVSRAS